MSEILNRILALVARREVVISDHGYDELAADGILVRDVSRNHRLQAESGPLDGRFRQEKAMSTRRRTKYVLEGQYAAAVEVDWIESDTGWSPYLSLEDAQCLDEVREALRRGDLKRAGQLGRVYQLTPLAV